jgi:hypothetical protein
MTTITFKAVYDAAFENNHQDQRNCLALEGMWETGLRVFEKFYGDNAQKVMRMCYEVSPRFCLHVVTVVYGTHWHWTDPSDYDKSLITTVALILDTSFNQFKTLQDTFFQSAKSIGINGPARLLQAIQWITQKGWLLPQQYQLAQEIIESASNSTDFKNEHLTDQDKEIIKLAVMATLRKNKNEVGLDGLFSKEEMQKLFFHLNTYLGCPRVWDACTAICS